MRPTSYFNASHDIAVRSGVIAHRYRTADGRFILNEDDMRHIRLLPAEYSTGIDAIPITESEASELIAAGGYQMGELTSSSSDASAVADEDVQTETDGDSSPDEQESESSDEDESAVDENQDGNSEGDVEDPSTQQDEP